MFEYLYAMGRRIDRLPRSIAWVVIGSTACVTPRPNVAPVSASRPSATESAEVLASRHVQVEGGTTITWNQATRQAAIGETVVRIAPAAGSEFRFGINSYAVTNAPGVNAHMEDVTVGVKLMLVGAGSGETLRPAVALLAGTSIPSSSGSGAEGRYQPALKLAAGWALGSGVSLTANAGAARRWSDGEWTTELGTAAQVGMAWASGVGAYAEYYNTLPRGQGLGVSHYGGGGLAFPIAPNLALDAHCGFGRTVGAPTRFCGLGAARRW